MKSVVLMESMKDLETTHKLKHHSKCVTWEGVRGTFYVQLQVFPVILRLLSFRYYLQVLQSIVGGITLCIAAGDSGAVADCDRTGGQFRKALILSVGTQFFCNDIFKRDS